ncbi:TIGR03032 family protein [Planctomycetes bacterium K23_9]|uniref:Conserved hypothetical protein CHP03032 domain-containing protein n=1 Tax=Stieleria marina TaxID=1930275 RepID=A0A517NNN5_9BACT|nr:hypothetical protein K239x_06800 [Planctomycetes bacterium K23_9]
MRSKAVPQREIAFRASADFSGILRHLNSSLLVSTYAAGKVAIVGAGQDDQVDLRFHNFQQAMGMAWDGRRLAVGGQNQIWILEAEPQLANQIPPTGQYDQAVLYRRAYGTGNIHVHEMQWTGEELWFANTLFSCLCTLDGNYSFVPRWQPSFIKELAPEDRCHLNGMTMQDGMPKYVSVLGMTNQARGWRENKASGGAILDVPSGEIVSQGLAMPHSPRIHNGRLLVLNSGCGTLESVDESNGDRVVVDKLPGYLRGMDFAGQFAFIGMSRARETSVFGGIPIEAEKDDLRCGVGVVDLHSGRAVAWLQMDTGVEEIFGVTVVPNVKRLAMSGPYPDVDESEPVWLLPPPGSVPPR